MSSARLEAAIVAARKTANRLHHLSMRYIGAFVELALGKPVDLLPKEMPGRKEVRDLIDLALFCRAEINALTGLLVKKGIIDKTELFQEFANEYEILAQGKAKFLGCEISDDGLVFKNPEANKPAETANKDHGPTAAKSPVMPDPVVSTLGSFFSRHGQKPSRSSPGVPPLREVGPDTPLPPQPTRPVTGHDMPPNPPPVV